MSIAFFDSGAGGLTLLATASQLLPSQDFIYFADSDYLPYGEKSALEVKEHIQTAIDFIASKKPQAIVLACNTATSLMLQELRKKNYSFPILGMEPAVKLAVDQLQVESGKKILITGTQITMESQRLKNLMKRFSNTAHFDTLALPQLVRFVENKQFAPQLIAQYLAKNITHPQEYQAVVLGCTHFSFFKENFSNFFKTGSLILDGNQGTVKQLKNVLKIKNNSKKAAKNKIDFYFSSKKNLEREKFYRQLLAKLI